MDVVNSRDGIQEQQESLLPDDTYVTDSESSESNYQVSDDTSDDGQDLKTDLQKTIPECYKSDLSCSSTNCSEITNDDDVQATALCQFMDILNDLDEVLDKSLLACLDGDIPIDCDGDDVICKTKEGTYMEEGNSSSMDDDTQVTLNLDLCDPSTVLPLRQSVKERSANFTRGRSKSFSEMPSQREVSAIEQTEPVDDGPRSSMRRLDPIAMPSIPLEQNCEPLTLPVILFLEHHVNLRPTSAPIQLQVTTANLTSEVGSAPLIVGRRTLLMNRTLSLPSPEGSEGAAGDWTGRNRSRSAAHSVSSTSTESLNAVTSPPMPIPSAPEERLVFSFQSASLVVVVFFILL